MQPAGTRAGAVMWVLACALLLTAAPSAAQEPDDPPRVRTIPVVSGAAVVGSQLTASAGTWRPLSATPSYQWLRCDPTVTACEPIAGEKSLQYTIGSQDAG